MQMSEGEMAGIECPRARRKRQRPPSSRFIESAPRSGSELWDFCYWCTPDKTLGLPGTYGQFMMTLQTLHKIILHYRCIQNSYLKPPILE